MCAVPSTSPETSQRMRRIRTRDTQAEVNLRSCVHRLGLRYRIDARPVPELNRRADLVLKASRVAVFVDGCFWHACPVHGATPKSNAKWWAEKLAKNRSRDRQTDRALRKAGWGVVRVWEHEEPHRAAARVYSVVRRRLELQAQN